MHRSFHDAGRAVVIAVYRFTALKINIRILRRAANERMVGVERPAAVSDNKSIIYHGPDLFIAEQLQLIHFVRSAEAIKKVDERNSRL